MEPFRREAAAPLGKILGRGRFREPLDQRHALRCLEYQLPPPQGRLQEDLAALSPAVREPGEDVADAGADVQIPESRAICCGGHQRAKRSVRSGDRPADDAPLVQQAEVIVEPGSATMALFPCHQVEEDVFPSAGSTKGLHEGSQPRRRLADSQGRCLRNCQDKIVALDARRNGRLEREVVGVGHDVREGPAPGSARSPCGAGSATPTGQVRRTAARERTLARSDAARAR